MLRCRPADAGGFWAPPETINSVCGPRASCNLSELSSLVFLIHSCTQCLTYPSGKVGEKWIWHSLKGERCLQTLIRKPCRILTSLCNTWKFYSEGNQRRKRSPFMTSLKKPAESRSAIAAGHHLKHRCLLLFARREVVLCISWNQESHRGSQSSRRQSCLLCKSWDVNGAQAGLSEV